jgi:hypothetical protein
MSDVQERVDKGVKLLNKHFRGWRKKVNPRKLSMGTCTSCVLGQVYGNYIDGALALKQKVKPNVDDFTDFLAEHGFTFSITELPSSHFTKVETNLWAKLNKLWRKALKPKVAAKKV